VSVRYIRKIIRITAMDSPNVRAGRDGVLKGVLSNSEYLRRRLTWDKVRQTIGLDGEFYEGASVMMYPSDWIAHSEQLAISRHYPIRNSNEWDSTDRWIGCDPAEGGDRSAWCIGDRRGLLGLVSILTPDTTFVTSTTLRLMREWDVPADHVCFDRGGGGKQHADRMREGGYNVRTVAFGETVVPQVRRRGASSQPLATRIEEREDRTIYKNRRAEMYGTLMDMMDPCSPGGGWALPSHLISAVDPGRKTLKEQLLLIPKTFDAEGKLYVLPKNKPKGQEIGETGAPTGQDTLSGLVGHSPDEADALVVMIHAMTTKPSSVFHAGVS
jgi:hypothetical protein